MSDGSAAPVAHAPGSEKPVSRRAATELHPQRHPALRFLIGIDREDAVPGPDNLSRFLVMLGDEPHLTHLRQSFDVQVTRLGQVAVGHAMRKLLHLSWAVWTTGRPFDAEHYPWAAPAHVEARDQGMSHGEREQDRSEGMQAAGLKPDVPARTEVTAARTDTVAEAESVGEGTSVDFAHLKTQLSLARVLDQLGVLPRLRGTGPQRRGPCPLHRGDARGRTFSVNLDEHVFHCFDKSCGQQGDVIDLWAAAHGLTLREAALDLVRTFGLEPAPRTGTEKRNG